jgi:hypothetical protein
VLRLRRTIDPSLLKRAISSNRVELRQILNDNEPEMATSSNATEKTPTILTAAETTLPSPRPTGSLRTNPQANRYPTASRRHHPRHPASPFRRLLPFGLDEFFDVPLERRSHRRRPTKLFLRPILSARARAVAFLSTVSNRFKTWHRSHVNRPQIGRQRRVGLPGWL